MTIVWLALGALALFIAYQLMAAWRYRVAIKRYRALPAEEQRKVGIYLSMEISLFPTLGYCPSPSELGIRWRESLAIGPEYVIRCYRSVSEFSL